MRLVHSAAGMVADMLPDSVQAFIDAEIASTATDFSDLRAVFLNGTLKRSPLPSHTEGLIDISGHIMTRLGVRVDVVRAVDHVIPPGCTRTCGSTAGTSTTSRRSTGT